MFRNVFNTQVQSAHGNEKTTPERGNEKKKRDNNIKKKEFKTNVLV